MRRLGMALGLALCLPAAMPARAADPPLTLEQVLALADAPHPALDGVRARQDLARAEQALAESGNDLRVNLEGMLRSGHNTLTDKFAPDHLVRLHASKTLWDGGRLEATLGASRLESDACTLDLLDARAQRRLTLMGRFLDVLLADQAATADEEFMAVAYVGWDNGRERHQLGQISTPELADLEARFQDRRRQRNDSQRRARERRALLASAMNQPGRLPAELAEPRLAGNDRSLPDFDTLAAELPTRNPRLLAQEKLLAASRERLRAARADERPSLGVEAEAAAYSREATTRDDVRAGLVLAWPLFQGRRDDARLAQELARFHLLQSQYDQLLLELGQTLFQTWQEIQQLRDVERPAARTVASHRDWALERARAEYELELKTTLGTSMAETQAARLRLNGVEYGLALAWERLAALLGTTAEELDKMERKP